MQIKTRILVFIAILNLISVSNVISQIIVTIEKPPLNQITVQDLWRLTFNNPTKETFNVYINGTVDEPTLGQIYEGTSSEFQLKPGLQRMRLAELDIRTNFYLKKYEEILIRTGTVPEGNYEICVNVINTKDNAHIGKGCITHSIISERFIQLISPVDSEIINPNEPIVFKHGSVILQNDHPTPPSNKRYTIRIVEVSKEQSPESAILYNPAFFKYESENLVTIYPVGGRKFEANKTYAWNVTVYENDKEIATSDVWTFTIASKTPDSSKIELISPSNNSTINLSVEININKIKFSWKLPDVLQEEPLSFNLKIVEVKEGQLLEEAIKQNKPILEAKEIRNTLFEVLAKKDTNKIDTTGRRPTGRLIHPGSVTGEIIYQSGTYAWQVSAVLSSGRIIPSEIFSFTCATETTTVTSCGWPTLINEFIVKSDGSNIILNSWPSSSSIPVYIIPCISADSVWGWASGCYNPFHSSIWPPLSRTCAWYPLYDRGACWITSSDLDWKRVPININRIFKNYFTLSENVTNVRLYITCDDSVDIYINPSAAPLNHLNPGYVGSHNSYSTLGIVGLPDLHMGTQNLIIVLKNTQPAKMALIYGLDYTTANPPPPTDPPLISFPSLPIRLCIDSEIREIEIRASLLGRINRGCTELTISTSEGLCGSMTFTPRTEPFLTIEHLGVGEEDLQYSAYVRLHALWLMERLVGANIYCATITATLRAGNGDCTEFNEQSWTFTLDVDNRPPVATFISPSLSIPTSIPDYRLIVPLTEPHTYERIEEPGGYCLGLPLPSQFLIDINWASGLTSEDIQLNVLFQRKRVTPTEADPNIYTIDEDIIHNMDRSILRFTLETTAEGHRLIFNSSAIVNYLNTLGITLQEGDLLTLSLVFNDHPCVCEITNFQASYRFKVCL